MATPGETLRGTRGTRRGSEIRDGWDRSSSLQSPTKASLAKYSPHILKQQQQRLGHNMLTNSPSAVPVKRFNFNSSLPPKSPLSFADKQTYPQQRIQQNGQQVVSESPIRLPSSIRPKDKFQVSDKRTFNYNGLPVDANGLSGPKRKRPAESTNRSYLSESDRLNNAIRDVRRKNGVLAKDNDASNRIIERDMVENTRNMQKSRTRRTVLGQGMRLSKTPPPDRLRQSDDSDPILPPTPERGREPSPNTRERDREAIFSSGNRRSRRKYGQDIMEVPEVTDEARNLRVTLSKSHGKVQAKDRDSKDTIYVTCLKHLRNLEQQLLELEDELIVAQRQANAMKQLIPATSSEEDIADLIKQCLSINDDRVKAAVHKLSNKAEDQTTIPTRISLPLKIEFSLPHLQALCPLRFLDREISITSDTSNSKPIAQQRHVFRGFAFEELLHFNVEMNVSLCLPARLVALKIVCSKWALPEIGAYLSQTSEECNINNVLYAIASYTAMAKQRSQVWYQLGSKFGRLASSIVGSMQQQLHVSSEDTNADEANRPSEIYGSTIDRRAIVTNLSRQIMTFRRVYELPGRSSDTDIIKTKSDDLELLISWSIHLDSSGEACSRISASTKISSTLNHSDDINSEAKIPSLFSSLIRQQGVFEGTSTLIQKLFGELSGVTLQVLI